MSEERELVQRFIAEALCNPHNREILARLPELHLPQTYLVAGCLFQTVWNLISSRPATENIKDYDVFYFDDSDLSWEAEDAAIRRANALFADLDAKVELRNQARVHLWYEQHFGAPCPRLNHSRDGIDRFLIPCTCVGIQPSPERPLEVYAPYGLAELYAGILRPNPVNDEVRLFQAKAASYRARWPWLTIRSG